MSRRGATLLVGLTLTAWLPHPSAAGDTAVGDAPEARAVVQQTVEQIVAILQNPDLDSDQRRGRIEQLAYERFHFSTMSRLVLGKSRKRFSDEQLERFMTEFRLFLSRSYGQRLNRYDQEKVEITGERTLPRGDKSISTRIVGGQANGFEIDYRMRKKKGVWGVIDVKIEGVSLVSSYRDQFAEVLGDGGPEKLLLRLHEKNTAAPPAAQSTGG